MAFSSKSLSSKNGLNGFLKRNPLLFGASFLAIIIGASFGMQTFTELGVEKRDNKVTAVTQDEEVKRKLNTARRFDIREEYFRHVSRYPESAWDNVRVPRPDGVAEWGEAQQDSRKPIRELVRK
ncbi:Cytochrome oxidase assembly [Serendipita sp. 411]|nr:Cytochrome oxidase assembly [Serendipita sp. 397]KAG8823047.1 Cytochrome oxidase assembly [Serendipita sp. 401]KAG8844990.1 Cytochrome oxidase assembly [Serendipita sp. 411]KAG9054895.1 Cytochrome oxidase assembly [Serendipita sp. 407]